MSVPRIRVDGFNKNFENKIFGEIVRSVSTRMYIKSVVSDLGKYEVIQQGDTPILGYSDDQPFEKYKSVILFGDHTLSLYLPKAPFLLATDGIKILQSTILKRDYLYYLTQNYIPKSQGYKRHFSVLKQVIVNYSQDYSEQSAIGSLFRALDNLLTSYKENLANYQSLKATMLSKMFPKGGQAVPEIRLDGFEGEWESDAFESYLTESRILGDSGLDAKKITVKLWGKGVVEKEEKYAGSSNTQYYIRKAGQFIYSKLDFQNQAFGIVPTELDGYQSTLDLPTFDVKGIDTKFLLEYVMRREFYEYQGLIANGSRKAKRIHPDDFLSMQVRIPSLAEQQAIGIYFSNLDQLITSYQEKITQFETLKKKLLQDMFI